MLYIFLYDKLYTVSIVVIHCEMGINFCNFPSRTASFPSAKLVVATKRPCSSRWLYGTTNATPAHAGHPSRRAFGGISEMRNLVDAQMVTCCLCIQTLKRGQQQAHGCQESIACINLGSAVMASLGLGLG